MVGLLGLGAFTRLNCYNVEVKIAILGYGSQGNYAYKYWSLGNDVTICDKDESIELPPKAKSKLGPGYLSNLDQFDLIIRGPGIHPKDLVEANSPSILSKVTSVTNEFFKVCPSKKIVAVTGTKGKGTTSTLIAEILRSAGNKVHLGGNIGTPPLKLLEDSIKPDDWVVLELANFQLIDLKHSPHIAVCLMVVDEHLDWHTDAEEYVGAKKQLFLHQAADDIAIYYANNPRSKEIAYASRGQKIPFYALPGAIVKDNEFVIDSQSICRTNELKLVGKHNWQNICAAVTAAWQITQDVNSIRKTVVNFSGLEHRIELVREVNNVKYFNDSYASGGAATIAAIEAITGNKVVIIGGYERNLKLDGLAQVISDKSSEITKILLIGASAKRMAGQLDKVNFTNYQITEAKTMSEIVSLAQSLASPGDSVILSPGFASFDMFKNFEERGNQYKAAVKSL